jgi:hypothetical protein
MAAETSRQFERSILFQFGNIHITKELALPERLAEIMVCGAMRINSVDPDCS